VTNSRTHRTQGKPRARERIAAERAARKRAEARRRLLLAIGAVTAVVAIVATLVTLKLTAAPAHLTASESAAPAAVARQVTTVRPMCWTRPAPDRWPPRCGRSRPGARR
jgi:hypothetical protein